MPMKCCCHFFRISSLLILLAFACNTRLAAQITASFTISPSQGCAPQVVSFTSTSTGTISSYSWNFGNGAATSHLQNPSTTYTSAGTYTVTLTVNGTGGTKTASGTVTIYPAPIVSLSFSPSAGCNPLTVNFSSTINPGTSGSVTQLWDFRDGNTSSGSNPSHTYTSAGTFFPALSVTNSKGCSATFVSSNSVTVYPKPTVSFSGYPTGFCTPSGTVSFTGKVGSGSSPYTYYWDFGDGGGYSTGALSPTHSYYAAGTYTVKLKVVDANGCIDSSVQSGLVKTHQNNASFSGPSVICVSKGFGLPAVYPVNAIFKNTSAGHTVGNTFWDYGDLFYGFGDSVAHAYTTAGTYTVKMVTQVGNCYDTVIKTLVVNPLPSPSISVNPQPTCPVPTTVNFSTTGSTSYQWSWASGGSASGATASKTYLTGPLRDTVMVIATNSTGCSDTAKKVFNVDEIRIQVLNPYKGCVPFTYKPRVLLLDAVSGDGKYPTYTASSIFWDFGDGDTLTADTPTHVYTQPGVYTRIVKVITQNGCIVYDTSKVYVGDTIKPSFTFTPDTVCPKTPVFLDNTSRLPSSQYLTYSWSVGQAVSNVNGMDAYVTYYVPGVYDMKLYADSNGCIDSAVCLQCMVVLPANADFRDSIPCPPNHLEVHFINSSIGATSNTWSFGDGTNSSVANPVHHYPDTGFYVARLITTNSTYGCTDTLDVPIRLTEAKIDFRATDTTLCELDTLFLKPTITGGAAFNSCKWWVDGRVEQDDPSGQGTYYVMRPYSSSTYPIGVPAPVVGYHDVTVEAHFQSFGQKECLDTVTKRQYFIVSHPRPDFQVSAQIGCTPYPAMFYDSTKYTPGTQRDSLLWRFGDGTDTVSLASSILHTYLLDGVYDVTLVAQDWNGCVDSVTKPAYVQARKPNAYFQVKSLNACIGQVISFPNLSVGATGLFVNWDYGDGDTSAGFHGSHAYGAVGNYTVRMVVFDSTGCSDTMSKIISVTKPKADFSLSDTLAICPPLIVKFVSTSVGAANYSWDFKNSGTATIASPSSTFSKPGIYNVQLIVQDAAGCADTIRHNVRVLGYAGAFDYPVQDGCVPLTVNFTSYIQGIPVLTWDFGDGTIQSGDSLAVSHTYTYPGAYFPKLVFSDGGTGCKASSSGLDSIKVDAVIAGFKALPPCEKTPIQLVDTSFSYFSVLKSWKWNFGTSGAATGNPVTRTYSTAGRYPVTLIATNAQGCTDTLDDSVTIMPLPQVVAMPDTSICVPDAIYLSVAGAKQYSWWPSTYLSCTNCPSPSANPSVAISYIVTGTDSNGCANKDTLNIRMQTKTTFQSVGKGTICLGEKIRLFAIGATTYDWTPAESLDSPHIAQPYASPKATTTYIVTGKEGSCLADTHQVRIVVNPLPIVDAGANTKVIAGKGTQLQASGTGISSVLWSGDSTLSCYTCFGPQARPVKTTTYTVTATNEFGCTSKDSVLITVLCDGSQLFIPNTFSPNGDGYNDRFYARGNGIKTITSFRIYSRWGELMYERSNVLVNDESAGWDGVHNGRILTPDVYVYVIEAACESGAPLVFKGDVTLLK